MCYAKSTAMLLTMKVWNARTRKTNCPHLLRSSGKVGISGVSYEPVIPTRETVTDDISRIFANPLPSDTYKGIHFMLYGMRTQLFWDGNKRTSEQL